MVVGDNLNSVQLLVVGGGPGGYSVAERCAAEGMRVALVEQSEVGGACLNVGCIPSKALLHVAQIAASAKDSGNLGVDLSATVDLARAQIWMQSIVRRLQGRVASLLESRKVDVIRGTLRFEGPRRAIVTGDMNPLRLEFDDVVIATGSRPIELAQLPVDSHQVVDSTGALALTTLPASMAIVGAGYIGVEIGTAFAKLGSKVTIVDAADRILSSIMEPLTRPVARKLTELGIDVVLDATVNGRTEEGLVISRQNEESELIDAEIILSAVGRRPNTDGLDLEHLGLELMPTGHIRVDAQRRAAPNVYALGDVTEGPALAHKATAEAEVVARAVRGLGAYFEPVCVPTVVFSDPEIVSVGMTEEEAAGKGLDARSVRRPLGASGRALTLDRTDGFMELIYHTQDRIVLGIHMVGAGVSELAGEAALALEMAATVDDLALTIHPHPTLAEELSELASAAVANLGEPAHSFQGVLSR